MKLIHTADWQLGRVFGQTESKAASLRQARLDAVKNVLALARRERADAILAAGDLFEDNRIEFRFIEEMAALVSEGPIPVYLLPGNHDPLTHDSPYVRHEPRFHGRAVVLRQAEPLPILDGAATLYPCPAYSRSHGADPTLWIPPRTAADGIRIGIAHGPQQGTPDECGYPIAKDAAQRLDLDYLALGHWHCTKSVNERTWYAGTPEPCCFNEQSGKALVVDIAAPRAVPTVREEAVNTYEWVEVEVEMHGEDDMRYLEGRLQGTAMSQLTRVRLRGAVPAALLAQIETLEKRFANNFFHFVLESNVTIRAEDGGVYRNPLLQEVSAILTLQTATAGSPSEVAQKEARVARRALSQLAAMVREIGTKESF